MSLKENFMRIIKRRVTLVLLACIVAVTLLASYEAMAATRQSQTATDLASPAVTLKSVVQETLLSTAREFLNHRNQHLIARAVVEEQAPSNLSAALSARSTDDNAALQARVISLAELGEVYTGFATDVRLVNTHKVKDKLLLRIEETTKLYYARVSGDEPPFTEFQVERVFVFKKTAHIGWILEDVQYKGEGLAPINEVIEDDEAVTALARPKFPTSDAPIDSSLLQTRKATEMFDQEDVSTVSAINYSAMADYATRYVFNYNPAYRSFSADCTNFISQAMYAGGWTMVYGFYTSNSAWWYNWLNQSRTWAGAHNWYFFARGSGRTSYLSNVWYMRLAHVLQMDFTRDGQIDHTMIVTMVGTSDLYLTYHSTNTLNRSLRSIIAQYPSAWYYAHKISSVWYYAHRT